MSDEFPGASLLLRAVVARLLLPSWTSSSPSGGRRLDFDLAILATARPRSLAPSFGEVTALGMDGACEPGLSGMLASSCTVLLMENGWCRYFGLVILAEVGMQSSWRSHARTVRNAPERAGAEELADGPFRWLLKLELHQAHILKSGCVGRLSELDAVAQSPTPLL